MTAISMLKQDHKKVQGLFRKFQNAGAASRQQAIGEKVFEELDLHTSLEEEIFYPAVQTAGEPNAESLVGEAIQEHDIVKNLIKELKGLKAESIEYQAKFAVLMENVKQHIDEEEGQMLPLAESTFDRTQLNELGQRMAERKRTLTSPGLIGETFGMAKNLIADAVGALTGSPPTKRQAPQVHRASKPAKAAEAKRQPRRHAAAAKVTRKPERARPRKGSAKTQHTTHKVARKAPRKKIGAGSVRTRSQRGGTKQRS